MRSKWINRVLSVALLFTTLTTSVSYNSLCRGGRGFYTAVCTVWGFMAGGTGNFGGERDFD